jgi:hypothetical protein
MRWFIFGTLTAGVGLFTWEIAVPDYRSLNDPTHYYTDWKVCFFPILTHIIGYFRSDSTHLCLGMQCRGKFNKSKKFNEKF